MLVGRAVFRVGERELTGGPGSFVFVPRGTAHSSTVVEGPMRKINVYTPAGPEQFTLAVGTRTSSLVLPPSDLPPPDPEALARANRDSDTPAA